MLGPSNVVPFWVWSGLSTRTLLRTARRQNLCLRWRVLARLSYWRQARMNRCRRAQVPDHFRWWRRGHLGGGRRHPLALHPTTSPHQDPAWARACPQRASRLALLLEGPSVGAGLLRWQNTPQTLATAWRDQASCSSSQSTLSKTAYKLSAIEGSKDGNPKQGTPRTWQEYSDIYTYQTPTRIFVGSLFWGFP